MFEYNEDGFLINSELNIVNLTTDAIEFLTRNYPIRIRLLLKYKEIKNVVVTEVMPDLSFDAFWNKYNYKIGKKARAEKLWNALDSLNKSAAMRQIAKYESWLIQHPNTDKQYPETFLSNQSWNY